MSNRTCTVDGCDRKHLAKGLCGMHYQRVLKSGTTDAWVRPGHQIRHGTPTEYSRFGCRCAPCTEAERLNKFAYRQRQPDRTKAAQREYDARTKDQMAARKAADRAANPDKFRRRNTEYRLNNRDLVYLRKLRRRANEVAADNRRITVNDWRRLCDRYRHRCAYCGEQRPLTRDHVIPLSRGGRNAIGNLVPACGPCNYSKSDKLIVEWRQALRRRSLTA